MMTYLWIALGGSLGAVSRFAVANAVFESLNRNNVHAYPYGTFAVNFIGSFLIGLIYVFLVKHDLEASYHKHLFMAGFLGAFTTFSTFSLETIGLIQQGRMIDAAGYIGFTLAGCLLATLVGMLLAKQII